MNVDNLNQVVTNQEIAVGRFAPSPTGELHLGSLTTAIASYCHIKSMHGRWLLRMEDTDRQRCSQTFSDQILFDLHNLGLYWDDPVLYQSKRTDIYNDYMHQFLLPHLYGCRCSRKKLSNHSTYPRFCLKTPFSTTVDAIAPKASHQSQSTHFSHSSLTNQNVPTIVTKPTLSTSSNGLVNRKVRVQLPNYTIGFLDGLQGMQWVNPQQTLGDVVVRRAEGIINYFLAVSVDDGLQGVTHIMRGLDIMPLTTAQIVLMQYLQLPNIKQWFHLPLLLNHEGQKLSKQNLAVPIDTSSVAKCQTLIHQALSLLKQPNVATDKPEIMIKQATQQWQCAPLAHQHHLGQVDATGKPIYNSKIITNNDDIQ